MADDVGLGKTVEAGLILTELLLRRRIRRVLILCPAALRKQWQQEMKAKFSLSFLRSVWWQLTDLLEPRGYSFPKLERLPAFFQAIGLVISDSLPRRNGSCLTTTR
ncbi:MAG: SNF2-related protein [Planktothrix sp.]